MLLMWLEIATILTWTANQEVQIMSNESITSQSKQQMKNWRLKCIYINWIGWIITHDKFFIQTENRNS